MDKSPHIPISRTWQLKAARARFTELIRLARSEGPQLVGHGEEAVVILSSEQYEELLGHSKPTSLLEFFRNSPLVGMELDFERD